MVQKSMKLGGESDTRECPFPDTANRSQWSTTQGTHTPTSLGGDGPDRVSTGSSFPSTVDEVPRRAESGGRRSGLPPRGVCLLLRGRENLHPPPLGNKGTSRVRPRRPHCRTYRTVHAPLRGSDRGVVVVCRGDKNPSSDPYGVPNDRQEGGVVRHRGQVLPLTGMCSLSFALQTERYKDYLLHPFQGPLPPRH